MRWGIEGGTPASSLRRRPMGSQGGAGGEATGGREGQAAGGRQGVPAVREWRRLGHGEGFPGAARFETSVCRSAFTSV